MISQIPCNYPNLNKQKLSFFTFYFLFFTFPITARANEIPPLIEGIDHQSYLISYGEKDQQKISPLIAPKLLSQTSAAIKILTPTSGITKSPTTSLVIQYSTGTNIKVFVNQKLLDPATPSSIEENKTTNTITQTWYNISLKKGINTLTVKPDQGEAVSVQLAVKTLNAHLNIAPATESRIRADGRSTVIIEGQITDDNGQLIEQEISVVLTSTTGKFLGANQDPDNPGFHVIARGGKFKAELQSTLQPQTVKIRAAIEKVEQLANLTPSEQHNPVIGERTPTNLTNQTPNPLIPAPEISPDTSFKNNYALPIDSTPNETVEAYTQVEFIPNLRPSLVSGVVNFRLGRAGTDYYGSSSDFLNPGKMSDAEAKLSGQIFATGPIGEWLLTGAYNSARALNQSCTGTQQLFKDQQSCDRTYPVYGDNSTSSNLTPSKDSLFVRLERDAGRGKETDYFMWGDYSTTEFARSSQLYTATNRQLHGFKANYNIGNVQLTGLYSPDVQGFVRDTIAPTGTSGYYFLSHRLVIPGSENVFIETEELNRPGTVLQRQSLSRGTDYEIDYDRGTLLFRNAIQATNYDPFGVVQVNHIVTTYQFDNNGSGDTSLYAGRVQYNLNNQQQISKTGQDLKGWVAASYLRQNQGNQNFELDGADLFLPINTNTKIIAEYARSINDSVFQHNIAGDALRAELESTPIRGLTTKAYYRSVDERFSNDATLSFNPGQTRYGAEVSAQVSRQTQLTAAYDYEANYGVTTDVSQNYFDVFNPGTQPTPGSKVNNELTTIKAGIRQQLSFARINPNAPVPVASIEYVDRQSIDKVANSNINADEIVSSLRFPLTKELTFRAQNEQNIEQQNNSLYPDRTIVGLEWAVDPNTSIRLAQQFLTDKSGGGSITSLETTSQQKLSQNIELTNRYTVLGSNHGMTGEGATGIKGGWLIAPGLRLSLGYERIYSNLFTANGAGTPVAQPYTVGQSAASLGVAASNSFSAGIDYHDNPDFQVSAKIEHRDRSNVVAENTVLSLSASGKITPALTTLFRYQQASAANQTLTHLGNTMDIKLGLAYRDPNSDRFNGLFKYEYRLNPSTIPDTLLLGSGTGSRDHVFSLEGIYAPNWTLGVL